MRRRALLGAFAAAVLTIAAAGVAAGAAKLTLKSSAFAAGATIPGKYSCDGANVSPALAWTGAPAATKAFAILMDDPDAGNFTHWTTWNIPGSAKGLGEGKSGPVSGANDAGRTGYFGPCPPPGSPHRYVFRLYALKAKLALGQGAGRKQFAAAIKGKVLAEAQLIGRFGRSGPPPTPPAAFTLTSSAFAAGGAIPAKYTCDGADTSPPLSWKGTPTGTKSLAIVLDDPDAGGFVHWVTWGIAANVVAVEGRGGSFSGVNDFGKNGYNGPCPPPPDGAHRYVFHLYALSSELTLATGATKAAFDAAIAGKVLGEAKLTGTFDH